MTDEQKKLLEGIINNIVQPLEARIEKLENQSSNKPPATPEDPDKKAGVLDGFFD